MNDTQTHTHTLAQRQQDGKKSYEHKKQIRKTQKRKQKTLENSVEKWESKKLKKKERH